MLTPRVNDPLWLALFRALSEQGSQEQVAALAEKVWRAIRVQAGLKMVPDTRYAQWSKADGHGVPLEGDVAFSCGWDVKANPHETFTVANLRWTSDWWRANADAYDAHVNPTEEQPHG